MAPNVGLVAIGRNEGPRLSKCLQSAVKSNVRIVYVDSGSTDNSIEIAKACGDVVQLETYTHFTAALARNKGFARLRLLVPNLDYVQFVDGDCELISGWIEAAAAFLESHKDVAVVCGRRRERYPERSIYNWMCDQEWDTPIGEARACGGDAMMRADAFVQVGGYRDDLIAGEEPELCVRLRAVNWRIWRLDADMTLHDAAMTHFSQWWRRSTRAGYAFAQGAGLHGAPPERHWVWESRRAMIWGFWLPLFFILGVLAFGPWALILWLIYPFQFVRQTLRNQGSLRHRVRLALFQVLARFPEALGQMRFMRDRFSDRQAHIIEYK